MRPNPEAYPSSSPVARGIEEVVARLREGLQAEYRSADTQSHRKALKPCVDEVGSHVAFFVRMDWDDAFRKAQDNQGPADVEADFCERIVRRLADYAKVFSDGSGFGAERRRRPSSGLAVTKLEAFYIEVAEIGTERMRAFSRALLDDSLEVIGELRPDALPKGAEVTPLRPF